MKERNEGLSFACSFLRKALKRAGKLPQCGTGMWKGWETACAFMHSNNSNNYSTCMPYKCVTMKRLHSTIFMNCVIWADNTAHYKHHKVSIRQKISCLKKRLLTLKNTIKPGKHRLGSILLCAHGNDVLHSIRSTWFNLMKEWLDTLGPG